MIRFIGGVACMTLISSRNSNIDSVTQEESIEGMMLIKNYQYEPKNGLTSELFHFTDHLMAI